MRHKAHTALVPIEATRVPLPSVLSDSEAVSLINIIFHFSKWSSIQKDFFVSFNIPFVIWRLSTWDFSSILLTGLVAGRDSRVVLSPVIYNQRKWLRLFSPKHILYVYWIVLVRQVLIAFIDRGKVEMGDRSLDLMVVVYRLKWPYLSEFSR